MNGYLNVADCIWDWNLIAQDLILRGGDLHSPDLNQCTPLGSLFLGACRSLLPSPSNINSIISSVVIPRLSVLICNHWLTPLRCFGVDLVEYGAREKAIFLKQCSKIWVFSGNHKGSGGTFSLRAVDDFELVGFEYGPEPEDWILWWNEPTDVFAGDFWKMIEEGKGDEVMPGTWVE